ncbi:hypothetical protein NDI52_29605 [Leptolyngbya sp. PL-A3]|uniref:hypothetical protein n=1 Tax=Leptolyngbya sp. PL-A3 TaxID=2933911 RepID=UPI0032996D98
MTEVGPATSSFPKSNRDDYHWAKFEWRSPALMGSVMQPDYHLVPQFWEKLQI